MPQRRAYHGEFVQRLLERAECGLEARATGAQTDLTQMEEQALQKQNKTELPEGRQHTAGPTATWPEADLEEFNLNTDRSNERIAGHWD